MTSNTCVSGEQVPALSPMNIENCELRGDQQRGLIKAYIRRFVAWVFTKTVTDPKASV